jgi:chromosome segregation protein
MKALWWVEQFFKEGSFSIKNGTLIDPLGIRGPQEKDRYILSMKALKLRRQEVEKLVRDLSQKLSNLDDEITADTKTIQELNSIIHQVREAEAFMTNEHERVEDTISLNQAHKILEFQAEGNVIFYRGKYGQIGEKNIV